MRREPRVVAMVAASLLLAMAVPAEADETITVYGQEDPAVDRQAVQAAIDAVGKKGTVELVGIFEFDGIPVRIARDSLTLAGRALDDDGDGAVNEDWADGVDNDGDGLVDEDDWEAEIRGLDDGNGGPAAAPSPPYFNRALVVQGGTGVQKKLAIRDLKFTRNHQALLISPDYLITVSQECDDLVPLDATVEGLRVERNFFGNNNLGCWIIGSSSKAKVRHNVFFDNVRINLFMAGGTRGCIAPEGVVRIPIGTPEGHEFSDNLIVGVDRGTFGFGSPPFGIWTVSTLDSKIYGNALVELSHPLISQRDTDAVFAENVVSGSASGFIGELPAENVRLIGNTFDGIWYWGVLLHFEASGFYAEANHFSDVGFVDYYLGETTYGNTIVLTDPGTTVEDLGTGNTIITP